MDRTSRATRPWKRAWRAAACAIVLSSTLTSSAAAADRIYFSAVDNIGDVLIQKINAERVRIDISVWHLTEHSISIALLNRFKAGVAVRLIGDRGAMFEIDPRTKDEFYWLANEGVPIRLRMHPTWYPELAHWKAIVFVGQNLVSFGSANFTPFELAPISSTNYKDETVVLSDDPAVVNAFKTQFDRLWNDTTAEPESLASSPPYFMNWDAACAAEPTGNCADYRTRYPNPAPMNISTARLEPDDPLPPDLVWGQGSSFNNRLVQEINRETSLVQLVIYRLTVSNITTALLNRWSAGVPVRLLIEPQEYLNRKWPEFWLTHANIDRLWAAGVPIKWRVHDGLTHMKTLVTSAYATNASSNYAAAWQRDHNYFISAASKPALYQALRDRVTAMWNDPAAFAPFQPQPPDAATLAQPSANATGVATTPTLVWERAAFATSYDVYLGASGANLALVANVPAQLVNNPPGTYSWQPSSALASGTTYSWKVVSRTFATSVDPTIAATSGTRSFTTTGAPAPPPPSGGALPSPWTSQDVGATGLAGSATYSNGTFTTQGAGADIWGSSDSFHYVHQGIGGDAQIVARLTSLQNTHAYAKAGVMIRESLASGSAHVVLDVRPNGEIEFMRRSSTGGSTSWLAGGTQPAPTWLKLVRAGTRVTGYVSSNGASWTSVGDTTLAIGASARIGIAVTSHDTSRLNTAIFDNVSVTAGGTAPPPPPQAGDIVIYAGDVSKSALRGAWSRASDSTSPTGVKLTTPDNGFAATGSALAAPAHYFDVTFSPQAGAQYAIWLRLKARGDVKWNDSVWVQFSGAQTNGSPAYPIGSSSGLLVNLATDAGAASLSNWGWQNGAYWLSQPTRVTFAAGGTQTLRVQTREDGVEIDQIVLSPVTFLTSAPGPASNDSTIVPKP